MYKGRLNSERVTEYNSGAQVEGVTGMKRPKSLNQMLAELVERRISQMAVDQGGESFEDADDFEEEDADTLPMSHHEVIAMTDDELRGIAANYGVDLLDKPGKVPQEGAAAPNGATATSETGAAPASPGQPASPASS